MDYNDFLQEMVECIADKCDEFADVTINSIRKNNGIILSGLCIRGKNENAAPTIYMEHYYTRYKEGEDIWSLSDEIMEVYYSSRLPENLSPDFFMDYNKIKDNIFCKLINYDLNSELLDEVPYGRFFDLAIVAYCRINDSKIGEASILIKNEHIKLWKVKGEEIIESAVRNTRENMIFDIKSIYDVLLESVSEKELSDGGIDDSVQMLVVTNECRYFGAVFMIFKEKIKEISDRLGSDLYIIPSSIHELIIMRKSEDYNQVTINRMITEINNTELRGEEVLSNHAYIYSKEEQVLIF